VQLVQTVVRFLVGSIDSGFGGPSSADQARDVLVVRVTFVVATVVGRVVAATASSAAAALATAGSATDATAAAAVVVVFARRRAARTAR